MLLLIDMGCSGDIAVASGQQQTDRRLAWGYCSWDCLAIDMRVNYTYQIAVAMTREGERSRR